MAKTIKEQIQEIEDEILNTQKNKATEHHIGRLKAKLAQLKDELQKEKQSQKGGGHGFAVKQSGDATVGLIGPPSVGKSTLLNKITTGSSDVGDYDFTTLDVIPGMMKFRGARIQVLDLPGLITGASEGKGRGKEILSAIRTVDLLALIVDASKNDAMLDVMKKELYDAGIRINQTPPDITISQRQQGGITINTTEKLTHLSKHVAKSIVSEYYVNADVIIRQDITEDQLIDYLSSNRVYVPAIIVLNKIDLIENQSVLKDNLSKLNNENTTVIPISAQKNLNLDKLQNTIVNQLELIRVYLKPEDGEIDYDEPLILKKGGSVRDACQHIHRDFIKRFRYAFLWGPSAKHPGQKVGLDHVLQDEDTLSIVLK